MKCVFFLFFDFFSRVLDFFFLNSFFFSFFYFFLILFLFYSFFLSSSQVLKVFSFRFMFIWSLYPSDRVDAILDSPVASFFTVVSLLGACALWTWVGKLLGGSPPDDKVDSDSDSDSEGGGRGGILWSFIFLKILACGVRDFYIGLFKLRVCIDI